MILAESRELGVYWHDNAEPGKAPAGHRLVLVDDTCHRYWAHVPSDWPVRRVLSSFSRAYECTFSLAPMVAAGTLDADGAFVEAGWALLDEDGEIAGLSTYPWPAVHGE